MTLALITLNKALALLDPRFDRHWTSDGLPRMDAIAELTGDSTITRKSVTDAAPYLTRRHAVELAEGGEDEPGEETTTPEPAEAPAEPAVAPLAEPDTAPAKPAEAPEAPTDAPPEAPDPKGPGRGPITMSSREAMARPVADVLSDQQLTAQALGEVNVKVVSLLGEKERIEKELEQLYAKNEILKRAAVMHERKRSKKTTGVQAYLAAQAETRKVRAARANAFIAAGTTQADVADALRPTSKLDAAMNRRKPARGTARPPVRPLQTAGR